MRFYKYYGWNNDLSSEINLAPLINKTIRFKSPSSFNDKYDSKLFFINNLKGNQLCLEVIKSVYDNFKISCFSRNPCCPTMWSHYATEYSGFMIEYDLPKKMSDNMKIMNYDRNKPFTISLKDFFTDFFKKYPQAKYMNECMCTECVKKYLSNDFDLQNLIENVYTNKASTWSYEEEYRLIGNFSGKNKNEENDYFDQQLSNNEIVSITLGIDFPIPIKELGSILIANDLMGIDVYNSKIEYEEYKISRHKIDVYEDYILKKKEV